MKSVSTAEELAELAPKLRPGEYVVYHIGELAKDCADSMRLSRLSDMARALSNIALPTADNSLRLGMGIVALTQRKICDGIFEYRAVRIKKGERP